MFEINQHNLIISKGNFQHFAACKHSLFYVMYERKFLSIKLNDFLSINTSKREAAPTSLVQHDLRHFAPSSPFIYCLLLKGCLIVISSTKAKPSSHSQKNVINLFF